MMSDRNRIEKLERKVERLEKVVHMLLEELGTNRYPNVDRIMAYRMDWDWAKENENQLET